MDQGNVVCSGIREGIMQFWKQWGTEGRYTQPLLADFGNWPWLISGSPSIRPTLFWQQIKFYCHLRNFVSRMHMKLRQILILEQQRLRCPENRSQ